ncbi:hypothetical protein HAX54_036799 [Datura stramonium]|uniref:Uncharacterized protein n=1 Tax=Datura stramonium TaxID=4076 RepID=A0ABS8RPM5_DATST|nr:hypothetical protein [Datura stramonium]
MSFLAAVHPSLEMIVALLQAMTYGLIPEVDNEIPLHLREILANIALLIFTCSRRELHHNFSGFLPEQHACKHRRRVSGNPSPCRASFFHVLRVLDGPVVLYINELLLKGEAWWARIL